MIFVPLLHYFKCKNQYSGNEDGMRYLLSPGKRSVPDPDGSEGAQKEEAVLTVGAGPHRPGPAAAEGLSPDGGGPGGGGGVPVLHLQRRHCVLEAAALHSGLGAVVAAEG